MEKFFSGLEINDFLFAYKNKLGIPWCDSHNTTRRGEFPNSRYDY